MEQTIEDRARLVNKYWPPQYRAAARFILRDWDDRPEAQCPTCGQLATGEAVPPPA